MGMRAALVSISPDELGALLEDSSEVESFFFARCDADDPLKAIDIDKSWAAIHFLLTGTAWGGDEPECLPVLGGTPIGEEMDFGPARFLSPEQVQEVDGILSSVPTAELKKRFIPSQLEAAEIYPAGIWEEEGEEGFEYIAHWYEQLREFYRLAAEQGNAVLLAIV